MADEPNQQDSSPPRNSTAAANAVAGKQMPITVGFLVVVLGAQLYLLDRFSTLEVSGAVQATALSAVKESTTDIKDRLGRLELEIHSLPAPMDPHTIARFELTLTELVRRVEALEDK